MDKRLTVNQLVAFNLTRAREARRLTQDQAIDLLKPYVGRAWAKQTISNAERAADSPVNARYFDINEVCAIAAAFKLPLAYFLTAPPETEAVYTAPPERTVRFDQFDETTHKRVRKASTKINWRSRGLTPDQLLLFAAGHQAKDSPLVIADRLRRLANEIEKP